jgi:hypothetical protein
LSNVGLNLNAPNLNWCTSREEEAGMNMNAHGRRAGLGRGDTDFSTVEVTDTVAAINYNKRIITFAPANGQTRMILIDPSVPRLDQVQVGDQVVLLVTRPSKRVTSPDLAAGLGTPVDG